MTAPSTLFATHEVLNQPPPLEAYNLFEQDAALREAVAREGGSWGQDRLARFGAWLGQASTIRLGELANQNPPAAQPRPLRPLGSTRSRSIPPGTS